jgi:hypothetical protein
MDDDGTWTHGLLTGQVSGGTARCIGKATRLRVRQRELNELNEQRTRLEEELRWFVNQLADYERQIALLQEQRAQLRKVLPASGLEEIYAAFTPARATIEATRTRYHKARQQTQEARQSYYAFTVQLEREIHGIVLLASDARRVQSALLGVVSSPAHCKRNSSRSPAPGKNTSGPAPGHASRKACRSCRPAG